MNDVKCAIHYSPSQDLPAFSVVLGLRYLLVSLGNIGISAFQLLCSFDQYGVRELVGCPNDSVSFHRVAGILTISQLCQRTGYHDVRVYPLYFVGWFF